MALKTTRLDAAKYLDTPEALTTYLTEALATGDTAFIADAVGVAARAHGMSQIAKDTGLSRESLYKSLSATGNPEMGTLLKVLAAMNVSLSAHTRAIPAE